VLAVSPSDLRLLPSSRWSRLDGYAVFDRLVAGAGDYLDPGGHLIVETGSPQEGSARERIERQGGSSWPGRSTTAPGTRASCRRGGQEPGPLIRFQPTEARAC
jgi:methylase of polypeptide subunit release factors